MIKPKSHLGNQEMSPIIQESGIKWEGIWALPPSYPYLSPFNPPTTYTNNNGHVLCIDIQTDR